MINGRPHHYGFNGVEENYIGGELLNLEMDMRQYDPAIARWTSIDPITHHSNSTYNGFDNNPIFWSDPSGADAIYNEDTNQYVINGTVVSFAEAVDYAKNGGNADGSNNNTPDNTSGEGNEECCGGYLASYRHQKTPKEEAHFRNNPEHKEVVNDAAFDAGILATRVSNKLGGDDEGYSGAIRHSYWMYLVAVNLSPELAEKIGYYHEDFIITVGKDKGRQNMITRDGKMDLANNNFGINLARENPNLNSTQFEQRFFEAVQNKNQSIIIIDRSTIPAQSLQGEINQRFKNRRRGRSR